MGGCYELDNFDSKVDPQLAARFLKTCVAFCPGLVKPNEGVEGLEIIRHGVGLRPVRKTGVRIEKEKSNSNGPAIIYCYGHGGWGYQTSWASADMVYQMVEETESSRQPTIKGSL